jgi:hypothetical protein
MLFTVVDFFVNMEMKWPHDQFNTFLKRKGTIYYFEELWVA